MAQATDNIIRLEEWFRKHWLFLLHWKSKSGSRHWLKKQQIEPIVEIKDTDSADIRAAKICILTVPHILIAFAYFDYFYLGYWLLVILITFKAPYHIF